MAVTYSHLLAIGVSDDKTGDIVVGDVERSQGMCPGSIIGSELERRPPIVCMYVCTVAHS